MLYPTYVYKDCKFIDAPKIYGKTAIPEGRYEIDMYFWETYNDSYPHLKDVPNFTGILIHPGTNADHTEGCLLPGLYNNGIPDSLYESRIIYKKILLPNIKKALNEGPLFIDIKNDFPVKF